MFIPKLQYLILKWKERKCIELRHFYSTFTRNQKVWSGSYLFCSSFVRLTEEEKLFFFFNFIYLFIYLWLCWVFVSVRGLSPVAASGGHSSPWCAGLPPSRPLPLRSTGSRRAGSATVAHGPSRSAACGILPDQGPNPCPLHWQADSQPLRHQGSPKLFFKVVLLRYTWYTKKYSIYLMCTIWWV